MSQCQRCGAVNDPTSRFCVACGAPIMSRPPAAAPQPPGPTAPPGPPSVPPPAYAPGRGPSPQPGGHAVIRPEQGPPSSNLPFAETASPPTGADFEAKRAAAQAVAAAEVARGYPSAPPPGAYQSAPPGAAQPIGV